MKRLLVIFLVIAISFSLNVNFASASSTEFKLATSDGAANDRFGYSVAIDGNTAVVGVIYDDDNGSSSGSAYVYVRSGSSWNQQAKLKPGDGAAGDYFGCSVAIDGDRVVIGAYHDDDNGSDSGSAYVFETNGYSWIQQAKLKPGDGATKDIFGWSVDISGDKVVVGAQGDDDNGSMSGSAYMFVPVLFLGTWHQLYKFTPLVGGEAGDRFGFSVAISGDNVVIGAIGDDDNGSDSGSAYVTQTGGSYLKYTPTDTTAGDQFGCSAAIDGNRVAIGARGDTGSVGSVYVFELGVWNLPYKLTADDTTDGDYFGYSVDVSGDTAIVGAHNDDDNGFNSGSAYVFERNGSTWSQQAKLKPSDSASEDLFGYSVAIDGYLAVVGAWGDDDNGSDSGSAYVFVLSGSGFSQLAKLTPDDGTAGDYFGISVDISGDTAIVGAHLDDDNGTNSGSAYVFVLSGSNWIQQAKLKPGDGAAGDYFGYSVAISGNTAIVGAHGDDDSGSFSGSAYVFTRNGDTWSQKAKLKPGDGAALDEFGYSVAIDGDTAVVGADSDGDNGDDSGSAYVYVRSGGSWSQLTKLTAYDGAAHDYFGFSVDISGDTAVVGARWDDDNGFNSGSAYVFTRNGDTWSKQAKLTPDDGTAGNLFGYSIAISGNMAVVGTLSNSAYVFVRSGSNWSQQDKITSSDGEVGDEFGLSVDVSGDIAIVGAPHDDDNGNESGSAYVYLLSINYPPVADPNGPYTGAAGVPVTFDGSGSYDPDGTIVSYEWEFGDGDTGTGANPTHTYTATGTYTITLTVTDDGDIADTTGTSVEIMEQDFGDAPDPNYPTLLASNGARHALSGLYMGASIDTELNGQPDSNATGDDTTVSDDEDGITFTTALIPGDTAEIDLSASASGMVDVWIDYNGDGDWSDAVEQIFANKPVSAGANNLSFTIPADATPGNTFARFRISSGGGLSFDGPVSDGEVEDYMIEITPANEPPIADAGGPYTVEEGESFTLDASASYDPDNDSLIYEWDLDNDGEYDDETGETTTAFFDDDGDYTVGLKVTDSNGGSNTATATVTVNDLGPAAALTGDNVLDEGQTGSYDASGSTSSPDAIASYEWDWDYDNITFNPSGDTGALHTHAWDDDGTYTAAVRVTDDDGSMDIATLSVTVENLPPEVMVENLCEVVENMEMPASTENSLITSLDTAVKVLGDANQKNDVAAINALEAFINKVEAQRGKKISEADAEALIANAQEIIEELSGGT